MKNLLILLFIVSSLAVNAQKKIIVDLSRQVLTAYEDGRQVYEYDCVTGNDANTKTGSWYIFLKDKDYKSQEFDAEMPYAMKFGSKGQAIHSTSYSDLRSYTKWLFSRSGEYGVGMGTHGCVGLMSYNAKELFEWVEVDKTKITVQK